MAANSRTANLRYRRVGVVMALAFCAVVAFLFFLIESFDSELVGRKNSQGVIRLNSNSIAIYESISIDTLRKFKEILRSGDKTVHLSSLGGDSASAFEIGGLIHNHKLDVVVDGLCFSACAVALFPAGIGKKITSTGVVALHWGAGFDFHAEITRRQFPITTQRITDANRVFAIIQRIPDELINSPVREKLPVMSYDGFYKAIKVNPAIFSYGTVLAACYADLKITATISFDRALPNRPLVSTTSNFQAKSGEELVWVPSIDDWMKSGVTGFSSESESRVESKIRKIIKSSFGRDMKIITSSMDELAESDCGYSK